MTKDSKDLNDMSLDDSVALLGFENGDLLHLRRLNVNDNDENTLKSIRMKKHPIKFIKQPLTLQKVTGKLAQTREEFKTSLYETGQKLTSNTQFTELSSFIVMAKVLSYCDYKPKAVKIFKRISSKTYAYA